MRPRIRRAVATVAVATTAAAGVLVTHWAYAAGSDGGGSTKIIGGSESAQLDGQVAIYQGPTDVGFCSGTLISTEWVLTSKHCFAQTGDVRRVFIRAGDHDRLAGQQHFGAQIQRMGSWDIALLKLQTPVSQPTWVYPYGLATDPAVNDPVVIRGWGRTETGELADRLKIATMSFTERVQDPNMVPARQWAWEYHDRNAGVVAPGDSGGGIHINGRVRGVHSRGLGTRGRGVPIRQTVADFIQRYSGVGPQGGPPMGTGGPDMGGGGKNP